MSRRYDVIIVGGGLSGLVSGYYLARAGLKVLILEQHHKLGGYCSSFERSSFIFDVGIHYFGSLDPRSPLRLIFDDCDIMSDMEEKDPSSVMFLPGRTIRMWNSANRTIQEISELFPNERDAVRSFFEFLLKKDLVSVFAHCRNKTFRDLLDEYFSDLQLKSVFCVMLGNLGLSSDMLAAISGVVLYRDMMRGSKYFYRHNHDYLISQIVKKMKIFGCDFNLNVKIRKVLVEDGMVRGVAFDDQESIKSQYVLACCDIKDFINNSLGNQSIKEKLNLPINEMITSPSLFVLYLGFLDNLNNSVFTHSGIWNFSSYDVDSFYKDAFRGDFNISKIGFFCKPKIFFSENNKKIATINIVTTAPYKNKKFWSDNKIYFSEKIIEVLDKRFKGIKSSVSHLSVATPDVFKRYTSNSFGASYGWASILSQVSTLCVPQKSLIKGLYFAGHWVTQDVGQGGVSMVSNTAYKASKLILANFHKPC